ncbi:preprotein translocase subunit YajC [Camelliibacillus cellulosilyticus]|uniref:Preprotein translocase subunit YajC n=1 Tax=Camelliibacillus cellulosilyticus TaxID=2174486 RepID=A0ABV9GJ19_9BACL
MQYSSIIILVLFFVIFYFLLIRPQQKRQKQTQQMQADLAKGDKIVTIGGLHGTIDTIEDDKVTIKCNGSSRLTFDRSAIRNVVEKRTNPHEKAEKEETKQENES